MLSRTGDKVVRQVRGFEKLHKDDSDADPVMDVITLGSISAISDIEPELQAVAANASTLTLAQLSATVDSEQIDQRALAFARARAAELVTEIDDSTRDMVRDVIADGLAANQSYKDIADTLQQSDIFSADRASFIAETEVRNASGQGSLEGMKYGAELGLNLMKEWYPDDDPCPECQENADEGPIGLDELFPSGDDSPLAHPRCQCVLLTVEVRDDGTETEDDE